MSINQKVDGTHPSWFTRFWAVVRYEILSQTTGIAISENPTFAITYGASSFGFFLFALGTAMNSISSEFESGTIVPLLTKPVSRTMVLLGKLFAAFIIILVLFVIIFTYTTVGSIFVYGPQNNLELVPLVLLGNLISTFIWVSILLTMGALTKNTILTVIIALGLFLSLFLAIPITSVFAGASPSLNYFPGSGASGAMEVNNTTLPISTGTDNIGVNLVYAVLYPSANVTFSKIDITAIQAGETTLPTTEILYSEPIGLVALRALGIAFAYILVFLFIAWLAFKRSQILE
jgi:ABC-type transport system involved in multi-copper enzyme maturation permease subunit